MQLSGYFPVVAIWQTLVSSIYTYIMLMLVTYSNHIVTKFLEALNKQKSNARTSAYL